MVIRLLRELLSVRRLAGWRFFLAYAATLVAHAPAVMRSRSLWPVDEALGTGPFSVTAFGERLTIEGASFGLLREIYGRRAYSPPGFEVRPGDVVVDLGSHVGTFAVLACRLGARVVAVERETEFVRLLEANLERNGCSEATTVHGTIGDGLSVDRVFEEDVDLMKVDIEGSEFAILTPEAGWLDRVRRIAMEVHPDEGDVRRLVSVLERRGFDVELRDPGYLFARRA